MSRSPPPGGYKFPTAEFVNDYPEPTPTARESTPIC